MDTNTILIIINMVLTVVITPLISILKTFLGRISKSKCMNFESNLSRDPSVELPKTKETLKEDNIRDIEEVIKRLSNHDKKNASINLNV